MDGSALNDNYFDKVYHAKFYAQQCEGWMRTCRNDGCPIHQAFETIIILHQEIQKLEHQLKHDREYPDER